MTGDPSVESTATRTVDLFSPRTIFVSALPALCEGSEARHPGGVLQLARSGVAVRSRLRSRGEVGRPAVGGLSLGSRPKPVVASTIGIILRFIQSGNLERDSPRELRCGRVVHGIYLCDFLGGNGGCQVQWNTGSIWHRCTRSRTT